MASVASFPVRVSDSLASLPSDLNVEGMLNYAQAAMRTGLSVKALQHRVRRRTIPHYKIGRRVLFHPDELDRWMRHYRAPMLSDEGTAARYLTLSSWDHAHAVVFLNPQGVVTGVLDGAYTEAGEQRRTTDKLTPLATIRRGVNIHAAFPQLVPMLRQVRPCTVVKEFEFMHNKGCLLARVVRPSKSELVLLIRRP